MLELELQLSKSHKKENIRRKITAAKNLLKKMKN